MMETGKLGRLSSRISSLMQDFILALRNIGRNRRRSLVTILAVALSCSGLALFGGYVSWPFRGRRGTDSWPLCHIQITERLLRPNGGGRSVKLCPRHYDEIKTLLEHDPFIGPRLEFVPPRLF